MLQRQVLTSSKGKSVTTDMSLETCHQLWDVITDKSDLYKKHHGFVSGAVDHQC